MNPLAEIPQCNEGYCFLYVTAKARELLNSQINKYYKEIFDDFHPFGYVFLKKTVTKMQNLKLFNMLTLSMLQRVGWQIYVSTPGCLQLWNKRFQLIQQAQVGLIQFKCTYPQLNLFTSILSIEFPYLTELRLYNCNIDSLESLCFLNAPLLSKINLINNFISNHKPLVKSNFLLSALMVYSTRPEWREPRSGSDERQMNGQLESYSRWNFPLQTLRLQKQRYHSTVMNDLSFVAKLKRKVNQSLEVKISRQNRVLQLKLIRMFDEARLATFYDSSVFDQQINDGVQWPLGYKV